MTLSKQPNDNTEPTTTTDVIANHMVVLAHIQSFDEQQRPIVSFMFSGKSYSYTALTTAPMPADTKNRQVALTFVNGELASPLILGLIYSPLYEMLHNIEMEPVNEDPDRHTKDVLSEPVYVDGKKVTIEGSEMIELKCGDASITLTRSGKILIRGKYLLNRASGLNRIIGGSVQVN